MSLKTKLVLGSLANVVIFGSADMMTGQLERGLKKLALIIVIAIIATILEESISTVLPALDGWIFWSVSRLYVFVALFDGVFTVLRANDVVL